MRRSYHKKNSQLILALVAFLIIGAGALSHHFKSSSIHIGNFNNQQVLVSGTGAKKLSNEEAINALGSISVKGRAPKTGYARTQFGDGWSEVNGCDTRNNILRRDLNQQALDTTGCEVMSGVLNDPYTGKTINFIRGVETSSDVQIDHVVALSDAWQTGAQQLDLTTRINFANDPLELAAVDGPTNDKKGDGDAATWLPPNKSYRCNYIAKQILVKQKYGLWVTTAEHDAMTRVLATCEGQTLSVTN